MATIILVCRVKPVQGYEMIISDLELSPESLIDKKCGLVKKSKPLYRGTSRRPVPFLAHIRQDRIPLASPKGQIILFDNYMSFLGYPHRKSNTLSTTSNIRQTATFGPNCFRIYPFDGASYLWMAKFIDFMIIPHTILKCYWNSDSFDWDPDIKIVDDISKNFAYLQPHIQKEINLNFTTNPADINGNGEVLVHGSQYIGMPEHSWPGSEEEYY